MKITSSTNPGSAQPGSGGIVNASDEFLHATSMWESSWIQYLQLRLRQFANVMDELQQQQNQNMAVLQGFIQFMNKAVKVIYASQQKEAKSIRSLEQLATVTDQFQKQQDQNMALMRESLQSVKDSVKEMHESQQKDGKSIRSLEQPANMTDQIQEQQDQNMAMMQGWLQCVNKSLKEMYE